MILEIKGLNSYYGRAHILDSIDIVLERGETAAILGRNGAGKTTLLKSVIGLVREKEGSILFKGSQIASLPTHRISRMGIGYVPEERRIFTNLTVRENLDVGRRESRGTARWSLNRIFEVFPNLADLLDRKGGQISGGEQQMLTVARSLMGNPELMLLDEPSEGLAPQIVEQMVKMVSQLQEDGLTILLSEQNMHFAGRVSQRAYILERGCTRFAGKMQEVIDDPELRKTYLAV
jgi:branched-chain amino acid transport system ATP-binding protein